MVEVTDAKSPLGISPSSWLASVKFVVASLNKFDVSAAAVIALARKAIEEGVDGLALNVSEAGSFASVIAEAAAKGIPCVAFNIDADKGASGNLSYIAQDFVPAGRALGRRVASHIPHGSKVLATVHDDGVSALDKRLAGVRQELESHGVEVVRLCVGQNPERGATLILEAVAKRPVSAIVPRGLPPSSFDQTRPMSPASTFRRGSSI